MDIYKPTLKNRVPTTLQRQTQKIVILWRNFIFERNIEIYTISPTLDKLTVSSFVEKESINLGFNTL